MKDRTLEMGLIAATPEGRCRSGLTRALCRPMMAVKGLDDDLDVEIDVIAGL